jgi:hypothetical protein
MQRILVIQEHLRKMHKIFGESREAKASKDSKAKAEAPEDVFAVSEVHADHTDQANIPFTDATPID